MTDSVRILAVCGSLQRGSANLALLHEAQRLAPPDVDVVLFDGLGRLPHFDPDLERDAPVPVVEEWRRALRESHGVLIASPEYAFSLPGVLKNGIDWVVGSGELEEKIVGLTASVPGPERGRRGLQAVRDTLAAVRCTVVGGEPIARGPDMEPRVRELVRAIRLAVVERHEHHR
jgi:chromate reductase, NAD(P)H dehydrogenase (quinone)